MRMTEAEYENLMARRCQTKRPDRNNVFVKVSTAAKEDKPVEAKFGSILKSGKQTKTEMEYGRMLACEFPNCEVEPFAIKLKLKNGHVYSPDYVVKDSTGILLVVECKQRGSGKNGFRQHSYQRAKVMFDQAKIEYSFWNWRWSEKHDGIWNEKTY